MPGKDRLRDVESPKQILAAAEAWLQRQRDLLSRRHGLAWAEHCEWIESYLLEEVRQRLLARGWRPKA